VHSVWNERLGWLLLLAGFLAAVGLDPWSLSERDPAALLGSERMAARYAQAVVLAMGFLQVAVALVLREGALTPRMRHIAGAVLGIGTITYALGYVTLALWPGHAWFVPSGAAINLLGFVLLATVLWRAPAALEVRIVLAVFLFGMAIDVVNGMAAVDTERFLPAYIGPEDGVRQRMLRLARVAAIALSLLTLLARRFWDTPAGHWGRRGMLVGTVGMPAVLTAACLVWLDLKYLLPIPALAMTGAVLLALWHARRTAPPLEQAGWLLIAASMSVGLCVGLYAFDGPLPTPAVVGAYNDFIRRLMRLGHAYAIVLGLLAILLARQGTDRLTVALLVTGSGVTLSAIAVLALVGQPTAMLSVGPALIAWALVVGVCWSGGEARYIGVEKVPEQEEGHSAGRGNKP
jgi:hypothetical protein